MDRTDRPSERQSPDLNKTTEMENRTEKLNEFIEKIHLIEKELDKLENVASDLSERHNGKAFPEQEKLSVNMENLAITMTHETASQLGFYREDIENLSKFITLRENYNEFSDEDFELILDKDISIEFKKRIMKRFDNSGNMMKRIADLRKDWNIAFKNIGYAKIKNRLRI